MFCQAIGGVQEKGKGGEAGTIIKYLPLKFMVRHFWRWGERKAVHAGEHLRLLPYGFKTVGE